MNITREEILQYLRDHPNVNRRAFAKAIGMNPGNLISAINGRKNTSGGLYTLPLKYLAAARKEIGKLHIRGNRTELEKAAPELLAGIGLLLDLVDDHGYPYKKSEEIDRLNSLYEKLKVYKYG